MLTTLRNLYSELLLPRNRKKVERESDSSTRDFSASIYGERELKSKPLGVPAERRNSALWCRTGLGTQALYGRRRLGASPGERRQSGCNRDAVNERSRVLCGALPSSDPTALTMTFRRRFATATAAQTRQNSRVRTYSSTFSSKRTWTTIAEKHW